MVVAIPGGMILFAILVFARRAVVTIGAILHHMLMAADLGRAFHDAGFLMGGHGGESPGENAENQQPCQEETHPLCEIIGGVPNQGKYPVTT